MLTADERRTLAQQAGIRFTDNTSTNDVTEGNGPVMPDLPDPQNLPSNAELLPPSWTKEMFDAHKADKRTVGVVVAHSHNSKLWERLNRHRMKWNAAVKRAGRTGPTTTAALDPSGLLALLAQASPEERSQIAGLLMKDTA